jgi:hypothetical protein
VAQQEELAEEETLDLAKEERAVERDEIKTVLEQLAEEIEKKPEEPVIKPIPGAKPEQEAKSVEVPAEAGLEAAATETEAPPVIETEPSIDETASIEGIVQVAEEELIEKAEIDKLCAREAAVEQPETQEGKKQEAQHKENPQPEELVGARQSRKNTHEEVGRPEEQVQNILDRHQHDYLLGKVVKRDLVADSGELILKTGDTITEETLNKARKENKYLELGFYV